MQGSTHTIIRLCLSPFFRAVLSRFFSSPLNPPINLPRLFKNQWSASYTWSIVMPYYNPFLVDLRMDVFTARWPLYFILILLSSCSPQLIGCVSHKITARIILRTLNRHLEFTPSTMSTELSVCSKDRRTLNSDFGTPLSVWLLAKPQICKAHITRARTFLSYR